MKKLTLILAAVMALVVLAVTPAAVLAQSENRAAASVISVKALGIDAPKRAEVGEKIDITVFERGTQDGVKDARVWALTRENAEAIKAEIASIKQSGDRAALESAVENALNVRGVFLGTTNGAGKVEPKPAIDKAGGYLLVAFKRGYFPGFKPIVIVPTLSSAVAGKSLPAQGFLR